MLGRSLGRESRNHMYEPPFSLKVPKALVPKPQTTMQSVESAVVPTVLSGVKPQKWVSKIRASFLPVSET